MQLSVRHLNYLREKDAKLYELVTDLQSGIERLSTQLAANPNGDMPTPPPVSSVTVSASNGIFSAAIFDNNPVLRGITYFLEISTVPEFMPRPYVISLGPSRNWVGFLGSGTWYFRAYSQYPSSGPSAVVYFGTSTAPTAVTGGGSVPTPPLATGAGSGTARSDGTSTGAGYGFVNQRGRVSLK